MADEDDFSRGCRLGREAATKEVVAACVEEIEREAFRHDGETKRVLLDVANAVRRL